MVQKFDWLEYDVKMDAAFCFACRNFCGAEQHTSSGGAFTTSGFRNWPYMQ